MPLPAGDSGGARGAIAAWLAVLAAAIACFAAAPLLGYSLSFWFYLALWITLASGLNIMAGFTGYLPFGYAAFYGIGGYAAAICVRKFDLGIATGIAAAGGAGALLSLLFARTLTLRGIYFAMVSLALAAICRIAVANLPDWMAGGSFGITLNVGHRLGSYYALLAIMAATLLAVTWLARSRTGIALRAIRDDPDTAEVMGVDVGRARLKAWVLSAVVAALVGAVEAWYSNIVDADTSFDLLIGTKAIIYAVAGGLGTVVGPVVGTIVMLFVDDLIWQRFPVLNVFLLGLAIVLLMMFLPRGILGTLLWRKPRLRRIVF